MAVDRPTFHESWYRVALLRPQLAATTQVHRQHFRGQVWYVVQDEASNSFFRLNESAYYFAGLLNGQRNVSDTWQLCNEQLGDHAPTQGEVIQLLGQMYTANLLRCNLTPDAEGLFKRYRSRKRREIQSYLTNLLFIRFPLLDPDQFLDRWVSMFGKIFSLPGVICWLVIIAAGLFFLAGKTSDLLSPAAGILNPSNLLPLYLSFAVIKVIHEFGHAFACKHFGRQSGTGGEIHVMGLMLLVFTPVPYVDASSSWAFRQKWHRIIVAAAGMYVELAIAAVAAIVWANTTEGTTVHGIAYNVIFVASVSTLLFNGNPLLRYDAYYILSDLLEIANLSQRGKEYLYYLVKRHIWGASPVRSPVHTPGERGWLLVYALASTVYRIFISVFILMFVADKLFILGALLAIAAVIGWVFVPFGKFLRYLFSNNELTRVRGRAVTTTALFICAVVLGLALIPVPDRCRVEGIVEPVDIAVVHAQTDGFVQEYLASGHRVQSEKTWLLQAVNYEISTQRDQLLALREGYQARRRQAQSENIASGQIILEQLAALQKQIDRVDQQLEELTVKAPLSGIWVAPDIERTEGTFVNRGDQLGVVASLNDVIVRATAGQQAAALIMSEAIEAVEIRVGKRPDLQLAGSIQRMIEAGHERLPSAALGFAAGGSMQTAMDDPYGTKVTERFFEIQIDPETTEDFSLLSGQRVVVRITMPAKPLFSQWWRSFLQLIQRRFQI